jgi:sodium/potassium-transporting ATPase subunit alpha
MVKLNPFSNRLLAFGVIVEIGLILLIDYTPVGNLIFGTAPIPLTVWLFMIPFAITMLALEEFRKLLVRRYSVATRRPMKPCT